MIIIEVLLHSPKVSLEHVFGNKIKSCQKSEQDAVGRVDTKHQKPAKHQKPV